MSDKNARDSNRVKGDFRLGKWLVSPQLNQISRNGTRVDLQNLSMQVLLYLAERKGQVISKDELVENLWRGRIVSDDAVHRRISDLRRQLGDTPQNPKFIQTIPTRGYRLVAPVSFVLAPNRQRWRVAALIGVLAIATGAVVATLRPGPVTIEAVAGTPSEPAAMKQVILETSPPGAMIHMKRYGQQGDRWQPVGMSPLQVELPAETIRLRFVADGFRTVEIVAPNPSIVFNNVDRDYFVVELPADADVPADMVYVPGVDTIVPLLGYYAHADLGRYLVSRTEVSNRQYAEFVAHGGYSRAEFWAAIDDPAFSFAMVADRFVDSTGQPGPAFWVDGSYPQEAADFPVTGVSWYEAMAYANYRGMTLPTARHWARAALGIDESRWPLAPALLEAANIQSASPISVSDDRAMSTWGAVNLIGNVREWTTTTRDGESMLSLGLGFASQEWRYALPTASLPMQRQPDQGIRLVSYIDEAPEPPQAMRGKLPAVPAVSADEYLSYVTQLAHTSDPSVASTATVEYTRPERDWIRQRVVLVSDTLPEPLPVLIFRPADAERDVQPVLYLPPGDSYTGKIPSENIDITKYDIEFVVESGRALVWPIIAGTHDRFKPRQKLGRQEFIERWVRSLQVRRAEIGAVIDYLEAQPDFDADRTGLLAVSFGATFVAPSILATEHRIRSAVLISSALAAVDPDIFPAMVNPNTYWPRLTTPIMLLNGSYDISIHSTQSRDLLLQTIGTPEHNKRGIVYQAPHWPLPPHRVRDDALLWFDTHSGPVQ